jgi:hypothetical protein
MHIRMLDKSAQLQQEAVGVMGVNLIHAAFYKGANTSAIISSLLDELSRARIEVGHPPFTDSLPRIPAPSTHGLPGIQAYCRTKLFVGQS